jgi:hypothetical protein
VRIYPEVVTPGPAVTARRAVSQTSQNDEDAWYSVVSAVQHILGGCQAAVLPGHTASISHVLMSSTSHVITVVFLLCVFLMIGALADLSNGLF